MREAEFIRRNRTNWKEFENILKRQQKASPDQLANLFIQVTDDLAYARTYYPKSQTTAYLNATAAKIHQSIYRNKKESANRVVNFWKQELPLVMVKHHRKMLYSTLFFLAFSLIGAVSAAHDENFVRLIMGDAYVNMTIDNIKDGDPMGVYKKMDEMSMFFYITFNNVRVSFMVFAMGIFLSVGTVYMLFRNGVMVGSFQYFFYKYDVLEESLLTIWIHGTIEISIIVIAGGAGIILGNSLLFPGTHSRIVSLKRGAKQGMKVIVGLVPLFIVAGFLEGFITRHTEMPDILRLTIILSSLAFIIWYFSILPRKIGRTK